MLQKTLLMMDVMSKSPPLELVFESKYGKIIGYSLFGDGYIVLGFTEGKRLMQATWCTSRRT
jgi:WD repeat-containing protein 19